MSPQFKPLTKKVADIPAACSWSRTLPVRETGPSSKVNATVPGTVQEYIQAPTGTGEFDGGGDGGGGSLQDSSTGAEEAK